MAQDINKHLDRARRSLEKNKLREAVAAYEAALAESPGNQEVLQALADIHTRLNEPAVAAHYYGAQFDRLLDIGDSAKAVAVFTRFLRSFPQPPDRVMRYATLLQKQNRGGEALEQFSTAAELFRQQNRGIEALACYESVAALDPENPSRHAALGELAEQLGHPDLAARSYLRAGQLTLAAGALDDALGYFSHAHRLVPQDRTGALLFAEAKLRKGDAEGASALLEPFSPAENDTAFLGLFGEALLKAGRLDRASELLLAYYKQKPDSFEKLFELTGAFLRAGENQKAIALLTQTRDWMRAARKEQELAAQLDRLAASHTGSLPLAELVARLYEELNRETKYFDALVHLFDLYLAAGRVKEACDTLDRLVDIDPYDYRNQERIAKLEGKADPAFLQSILARAAKVASASTRNEGFAGAGASEDAAASEESRAQNALEDLMVQVEIFLQYSLQSKAVERLERIAELFPAEEERNERLRALYDRANWWPKGAARTAPARQSAPAPGSSQAAPASDAPTAPPAVSAAETHRDLAAIAEINRLTYRQPTPREALAVTAAEIGKHLNATRCVIAIGAAGEGAQLTAEYSAPGVPAAGAARIASLASAVAKAPADALGGIEMSPSDHHLLAEMRLGSALGALLLDRETQSPAGAVLVADASARKWKPSESFFLQAVGDQLMVSVNHTKLRSLVRSLAVADEKTGLLSRGAYIDCLLVESNRARAQNTPLSLVILSVDHGGELLRQHGDAAIDVYIERLARALSTVVRQTDIAVKYTAWALVFILPGTPLENAKAMAEKLRQAAAGVRPSWDGAGVTVSAIVAESTGRPADETEDRVTEWMNRAEAGIEDARQRGGDTLVALGTP